jgi:hypothetical protein
MVKKDDVQTHDNKIMFIQSDCVLQTISAMSRCNQWKMDGNKMDSIVIMDKKMYFVSNNL